MTAKRSAEASAAIESAKEAYDDLSPEEEGIIESAVQVGRLSMIMMNVLQELGMTREEAFETTQVLLIERIG